MRALVQRLFLAAVLFVLSAQLNRAQEVANEPLVGRWRANEKLTGVETDIEIFLRGSRMFGRVVAVRDKERRSIDPICTGCRGALVNSRVVGIEFIFGLRNETGKWVGGTVVDIRPGLLQGMTANCELEIVDGRAKILGYIWGGLARGTSYWNRVVD